MPSPAAWLSLVAELLDGLGAEWVVAGALAALEYRREARETTDLDLLILSTPGVGAAFADRGYDVTAMRPAGTDDEPYLYLVRGGPPGVAPVKIDVIVAETAYQFEAVARGRDRRVLTVEDVLVHKTIAWRPRDRGDIASILETGRPFDEAYVVRWCEEWGVADRWAQARAQTSGDG